MCVCACMCVFEHCEDQLLYKCSAQVPIAQFGNWKVSAVQFNPLTLLTFLGFLWIFACVRRFDVISLF